MSNRPPSSQGPSAAGTPGPGGHPVPGASPADPDRAPAATDEALRAALRSMPPELPVDPLAALQSRVLEQWEAHQSRAQARLAPAASAPVRPARIAGAVGGVFGGSGLGAGRSPRRWVVATALIVVTLGALLWWQQRPDPVLEELMRLDVLSQMAAGEM